MKALPIVLLVAAFCGGCTNPPRRPAVHDFGLVASAARLADQVADKPMLSVHAPTWLWDNRIRYRLLYAEPTQVRYYGQDLWVAAPPELFEEYLHYSGHAPAYPVVIRLLDFEQQFETPRLARVVLRFAVEAFSADHQQLLARQVFNLAQVTQTADAAGAIAAFSGLVREASIKIQAWATGLHALKKLEPWQ